MFISPRLSADSVVELIRASESEYVVLDESQADLVSVISSQFPSVRILRVADIVLTGETSEENAFEQDRQEENLAPYMSFWNAKDAKEEADKPLYFLHTSGSTGTRF